MTTWGWLALSVVLLALAFLGWTLLASCASMDQTEEDKYGIDRARRS